MRNFCGIKTILFSTVEFSQNRNLKPDKKFISAFDLMINNFLWANRGHIKKAATKINL